MNALPVQSPGPLPAATDTRRPPLLPRSPLPSLPPSLLASLPSLLASLLAAALVTLGIICVGSLDFPHSGEDSYYYRELGRWHWATVPQPFSSRFLQPAIVHLLSRQLHWPIDSVFFAMDGLSLAGAAVVIALIFRRLGIPPWLLPPALFGAATVRTFQLPFMPDPFYTLLVSLMFLLLAADLWWAASAGLVILFCARESTVVLSASILWVLVRRRRANEHTRPWKSASGFLAATVLGVLVNRYVSSHAADNIHHINSLLYLLVKAPYNFLKNVLGIVIWTNTLAEQYPNYACLFKIPLPRFLHVGGIRAIGIGEFSPRYPCYWIASALCTFGVLLSVVARELWLSLTTGTGGSDTFNRQPRWVQIAGVYGLVSFALAPLLGSATSRYVCYAWPAFWLWGMLLFSAGYLPAVQNPMHRWAGLLLLLVHLVLTWLATVSFSSPFIPVLLAIMLQVIAWTLLKLVRPAVANEREPDTTPHGLAVS